MFETAFAQLRYAASVLFAIPFDLRSLDRLVDGILATQQEFGAISPDGAEFLGGPELDEESRREIQLRRFRTQAVRAANETDYYHQVFDKVNTGQVNYLSLFWLFLSSPISWHDRVKHEIYTSIPDLTVILKSNEGTAAWEAWRCA